MIKNFLIVAWRTLLRNKLHSFINITGLAIGVSACLVIYLIVNFELSFNKKHDGYDRIYRIYSSFSGVYTGVNQGVPAAAPATIREEFTGIESTSAFHIFSSNVSIPSEKDNKDFGQQDKTIIAGPDFFNVFKSYQWIAGSPEVLTEPFKAVLTESKAKVYFGTSDPVEILGKEIIYRDSLITTVAGLIKDLPFNTDIDMTDFISYSTIENSWLKTTIQTDNWQSVSSSSQVFVLLDKNSTAEKLKSQLPILTKKYQEKSGNQDMINSFDIQPLSDLHYNAQLGIFDSSSRSTAHLPTLTILTIVAVLLLVIGAINFINLETAQSVRRAKEVGVRKTLGSSRAALLKQFLYQSFGVTVISLVFALPLAELGLQAFSDFVPEGVRLSLNEIIPFLIGIIVLVGLLAGLYPAFVLSSFQPVQALKNQAYANSSTNAAFLRKTLIVFQFSIAQVLIIAALAISWQINYLLNKDIGFKKDAVVYFFTPWHEKESKNAVLKNKLSQLTEITKLALSESPPAYGGWSSNFVEYQPEKGEVIKLDAFRKFGDPNYIDFYDIHLLAGRNLQPADSLREILINRTLLNQLGFSKPEEALGQTIKFGSKSYPIVGVVEDFHIQSLHNKIEPVVMGVDQGFSCFNVKFSTQEGLQPGLQKIEAAWKEVYPDEKFEAIFLDETLKNFYQSEQRTSKLVKTAMAMAIFISCLGLFGLVSYTTTQRMKEIGIRKVLGSSIQNIVIMLSKDFIVLVILAFAIASPIAWLSVKHWLNQFAYHIDLNAWIFIITALAGILIAIITVAYQTIKAANANPVNSLRNE